MFSQQLFCASASGLLMYKLFSGLRRRERLKEDKRKAKLSKLR